MDASTESSKRTLSDFSSPCTTKKPRDEIVSVFGRLENWWKYHIVWYHEYESNPLEYYNITSKFRRSMIDYLECFPSMQQCKKYIQSLTNDWPCALVIVSVFTSASLHLIDELSLLEPVHSIYIHRENFNEYSPTENDADGAKTRGKIRGFYHDPKELISTVSRDILVMGRQNFISVPSSSLTSSFAMNERTTCTGESRSNDDYFFNFLDSLTEIKASSNGKQIFVEECRRLFMDKQSVLRTIDEFDRTYVAERAVYWYTRNGFLYSLVNQALRQQNIEALLVLHFFIRDLDLQLLAAIDRAENDDWEEQISLYRGQRMFLTEIEDMKTAYQKGFFYSFLSTTKNIEVARMFSGEGQLMKDEPVQPVLFHFDCSLLKRTRGVANIQDLSDNDAEEEILFSPLYSFTVRSVNYDEDKHVWKIECGMDGDESNLSLLLHQRLIKLDIAVRVLMFSGSSYNDSDQEICQTFTDGMLILLKELVIPEANIVTLDEKAEIPKNTKHAVTALFLLKGLKSFTAESLAHKPHIPYETMAALWDCLATMCKEKGDFQRALNYYEKSEAYAAENISDKVARKVNMAQVNRMMNNYTQAWSIYRALLNEHLSAPNEDDFNVFSEIATDMPYVKSELAMEDWYPSVFNYLEYVYTQCQETPEDRALFSEQLIERYRALGHAYWYLAHNKEQARLCYNRWQDLLEENDESHGEFFMYLAHTYFLEDPIRAKSLYEQAIVECSTVEERWAVELAICYVRLGYLQKRKRFLIRCFYLLTYVADLSILRRKHLEEVGECYLYLAKSFIENNSETEKTTAQQLCEQALSLFLNVKPPTSNFREMHECAELFLNLQKNNELENCRTITKHELLERIYNETPITEQQLKSMLEETLHIQTGSNANFELITEDVSEDG